MKIAAITDDGLTISFAAQENSGKLVTLVKQQARLLALDSGADYLIVDGPPVVVANEVVDSFPPKEQIVALVKKLREKYASG